MKIATIIGARPQFIKAAPISKKMKSNYSSSLSEIIIHTGQHFDKNMSNIFFNEMNIPNPNYNLHINQMVYGEMLEKMICKIKPILQKHDVDGVLVYGDTNSTLAGSISAAQFDIPIFHVEAGLRSYNRFMHEENNRIITDHLSTLLFCPTENAVKNLKKEKIINGVIQSGDVMFDAYRIFSLYKNNIKTFTENSKYILATIHRRENIDSFKKLSEIFFNFDKINDEQKIIMPLHPHTKKKINEYGIKSKIMFIEPLGYLSMLHLLKKCSMVITDSGGLQKESFFAKKKCLIIRKQTEWVELIHNKANILCSTKNIFHQYRKIINYKYDFSGNPFGSGDAAKIIIDSIIKNLS